MTIGHPNRSVTTRTCRSGAPDGARGRCSGSMLWRAPARDIEAPSRAAVGRRSGARPTATWDTLAHEWAFGDGDVSLHGYRGVNPPVAAGRGRVWGCLVRAGHARRGSSVRPQAP